MPGNKPDNIYIRNAVVQHSDMIFRIAFQYVKNRLEAEDIMQDVFVTFINHDVLKEQAVKPWLIRVTINKSRDYLKSARKRKTVSLDEARFVQSVEQPEELSELDRLPATDRNIIYLYYYEQYTVKEIAAMMQMRENAIFTRLFRAREKLKILLEETDNE